MKPICVNSSQWLVSALVGLVWSIVLANPVCAQPSNAAQSQSAQSAAEQSPVIPLPAEAAAPLRWVKNDAYQIKYKVPAHWTQHQQSDDSLTRITYTSPDQVMMLTITKRKGRVVKATPRQWLDVLTRPFCPKEKLVFQTRYNRLTFWEATGFIRQEDRVGRYEALVTSHKGNTISLYLEATCRIAYNHHQETIYEVFSSVAPYRAGL